MKNGRDHGDDDEPNDPKITRIEDARRRRRLGLTEPVGKTGGSNGGRGAGRGGGFVWGRGGSVREWIIGGVIIAMAIGFVVATVMSATRTMWSVVK